MLTSFSCHSVTLHSWQRRRYYMNFWKLYLLSPQDEVFFKCPTCSLLCPSGSINTKMEISEVVIQLGGISCPTVLASEPLRVEQTMSVSGCKPLLWAQSSPENIKCGQFSFASACDAIPSQLHLHMFSPLKSLQEHFPKWGHVGE